MTFPASGAPRPRPRPSSYPTPYGAVVPAGITVPVALVSEINSATYNVGDKFEFKTAKDMKLGALALPKGTLGHGRVSNVVRATDKRNGTVQLQADSLDLSDGTPVWVNIDTKTQVSGHLADKHTRFEILAFSTDYSGNMILDPGAAFNVITIARRAGAAPLVTPAPTATPTAGATHAPTSAPTVAASGSPKAMLSSPPPTYASPSPATPASGRGQLVTPVPLPYRR